VELQLSRSAERGLARRPGFGSVIRLARTLYRPKGSLDQVLVVGTSEYEPWHLVAHLLQPGVPASFRPVWVRHRVPDQAPAHLAAGLDQLAAAGRHDAVLVVAPQRPADGLLERLADARRHGSTVLSLASAPSELDELSHDSAQVALDQLDFAQHLLPILAGR
jgi:hypothetical protein